MGCYVKPEQFFNLIFGYYNTQAEDKSVAGTGHIVFANGTAVPAGEIWVVTSITCWHSDSTARRVWLLVSIAGDRYIESKPGLAQWDTFSKQGQWVLGTGNFVRARFDDIASGTTGYLSYTGYKMKRVQ